MLKMKRRNHMILVFFLHSWYMRNVTVCRRGLGQWALASAPSSVLPEAWCLWHSSTEADEDKVRTATGSFLLPSWFSDIPFIGSSVVIGCVCLLWQKGHGFFLGILRLEPSISHFDSFSFIRWIFVRHVLCVRHFQRMWGWIIWDLFPLETPSVLGGRNI